MACVMRTAADMCSKYMTGANFKQRGLSLRGEDEVESSVLYFYLSFFWVCGGFVAVI